MSALHKFLKLSGVTSILLLLLLCFPTPARADTFVVNTPDDTDDGQCGNNHCSLREAINAANANTGPDTISFSALDGTNGDVTITLDSLLPPLLDDATTIDGSTVQGFLNEPLINIVKAAGTLDHAFSIQGNSCVIRAFSLPGYGIYPNDEYPDIWNFIGGAIVVSGSGNHIEDNVLGWGAWNNSVGVHLAGGNNTVSGSLIVSNGIGIKITGPGQTIFGNRIGTDGSTAIANRTGIADAETSGGGHVIGGPGPGQRNIISGNQYDGIQLRSANNIVQGNYIGTDATGMFAIKNLNGVTLRGALNTLIGGTSSGEGNLISGNGRAVAAVGSEPDTGSRVVGNFIGSDSNGLSPIPNTVGVYAMSSGLTTGGLNPGEGNRIIGNIAGVRLENEGNENTVIGNIITMNEVGVLRISPVPGAYGFTISQNSIFDNNDLGIKIYNWQPVIPSIAPPQLLNATASSISGQACPYCIVEIFAADQDPSGSGEGETYLTTVTADAQGFFSASYTSPGLCTHLTATSTNNANNTSEFSQNLAGNCYVFEPPWLYPLWTFITGLFILGVFLLLQLTRLKPGFRLLFAAVVGIAAGGVLPALLNLHPGVIVNFTPEEQVPYSSPLPDCDTWLDPAGFSPADGAVLETVEGQEISWTPVGDLPDGELRWMVELFSSESGPYLQVTEKSSIPLSAFALPFSRGDRFSWELYGEQLQPDGETWLPFCMPGDRFTFEISQTEEEQNQEEEAEVKPSPAPTEEPAGTEELEDCEPTVTALLDLNCRSGPGTGFENVGTLLEGESALVDGQNSAGTWVWILNPDAQGHCWVWREGVEEICMPERLQIIADPTAEPEAACQPDLDREACNEAGGVYDVTADPPECKCP